MAPTGAALFELSRQTLRTSQVGLGRMFGVSRRTAQRWAGSGIPGYHLPKLVKLLHPHDPRLAGDLASMLGTTLEALGIAPPPRPDMAPSAQAGPPFPQAPPPLPPDGVLDAVVVCAAAEAMNRLPAEVRVGLHAAFARASELNAPASVVERALRARLPPDAAAAATPADSDAPRPKRR